MSRASQSNGLAPEFVEAFLNRKHVVLGRELRPLSLWHTLVLKTYRSPFVTPDQPATWVDLRLAVEICQFDFEEWEIQPARKKSWRLFFRNFLEARRWNMAREEKAFRDYVKDFYALPRIYQKTGGGSSSHQPPEELALAAALIFHTKWPERKVWMMPIGKVHHYVPALGIMAGAELRWGSESAEMLEKVRAAKKKFEEEFSERLKTDPKFKARVEKRQKFYQMTQATL